MSELGTPPFDEDVPVPIYTRLIGERRALALLCLGAFVTLFVLVGLAQGGQWALCFGAMALVYGLAFFGIASEWFWGRWFAIGIATSGVTMAILGLVTSGWNGALLFWGLMHAAIYLPLLGSDMSSRYELQTAWRERWQLDDAAVARIKRAVHSTATALPTLIFYTLAPREGRSLAPLLLLATIGVVGLVRMRTWGIVALAGATVGTAWSLVAGSCCHATFAPLAGVALPISLVGIVATLFLGLAVAPFVLPAYRMVRGK